METLDGSEDIAWYLAHCRILGKSLVSLPGAGAVMQGDCCGG